MKQEHSCAFLLVALLIFLAVIGCTPITNSDNEYPDICTQLSKNFDAGIGSLTMADCDNFAANGYEPIWAGGRLVDIYSQYDNYHDRNVVTLVFRGFERQENFDISANDNDIPYHIGNFYRFDLTNKCHLMKSMASSGMFYDPELDAFEHLPECD